MRTANTYMLLASQEERDLLHNQAVYAAMFVWSGQTCYARLPTSPRRNRAAVATRMLIHVGKACPGWYVHEASCFLMHASCRLQVFADDVGCLSGSKAADRTRGFT